MQSRRLGSTSLHVTTLGFGGAGVGNLYAAVSDADARAALLAAHDGGMRLVDTAPYYGHGRSEARVGVALAAMPGTLVSTKAGRRLVADADPGDFGFADPLPFRPVFDYSAAGVRDAVAGSRARLKRERLDLVLMHDLGRLTHGDDHPRHLKDALDGGYPALFAMRDAGAIGAVGLGVNETAVALEVMRHVPLDAVLLAGRYTLLEQGALDDFLPEALAAGVGVLIGGPFNSGVLAAADPADARYDYAAVPHTVAARVEALRRVCDAHGVPLPAAALRFPLGHPAVASVVVGLRSAAEARQAVDWKALPIPPALWADLKTEGLLRPDAPVPDSAP